MDLESEKSQGDGNTPSFHIVQRQNISDEENTQYYEEYVKILETAFDLYQSSNNIIRFKESLVQKMMKLTSKMNDLLESKNDDEQFSLSNEKSKRVRRKNDMLQKKYECTFPKCAKVYLTQGSLQQHLKIKHQEKVVYQHYDDDQSYTIRKSKRHKKRKNK